MQFSKFASLLMLTIAIAIGATGCSQITEKVQKTDQSKEKFNTDYEDVILQYLTAKYNEKFVISNMKKEEGFDGEDLILAECHSKSFPEIKFEVNFDTQFSNVHNEKEISDLLKRVDSYSEEYVKHWEDDVEVYLQDNYGSVLFQNQYTQMLDGKISLENNHFIQTKFENPVYYVSLKESQGDLDSYLGAEDENIYAYHYVFVKDSDAPLEDQLLLLNKLAKEVSDSRIGTQQLYVYFLSEFSTKEIKKNYYANYEDPSGYFSRLGTVTSNSFITIEDGVVTDINI